MDMSTADDSASIPAPGRARRSPTADELRAWRAFVETSEATKHAIATRLQSESGLSPGDYAVMVALSDAPDRRLRSSRLAERVSWERSRLSHHLGRMERRGLITRQPADGDSRGAEVVLTEEGAHLYRRASAPHMHAIHDTFVAPLTAEQVALIEEAMTVLRAHVESRRG
jgi:DNA-binding MarR family transcriptional regulator